MKTDELKRCQCSPLVDHWCDREERDAAIISMAKDLTLLREQAMWYNERVGVLEQALRKKAIDRLDEVLTERDALEAERFSSMIHQSCAEEINRLKAALAHRVAQFETCGCPKTGHGPCY